jgi:hypothetical protein
VDRPQSGNGVGTQSGAGLTKPRPQQGLFLVATIGVLGVLIAWILDLINKMKSLRKKNNRACPQRKTFEHYTTFVFVLLGKGLFVLTHGSCFSFSRSRSFTRVCS